MPCPEAGLGRESNPIVPTGSSIKRNARPDAGRPSHSPRSVKASISGTRLRPHCSQADAATARQCATRLAARSPSRRTTLRRVMTGTIRVAPSSTAFCTVTSIFSPVCKAWTRTKSKGDSRSTLRLDKTSTTVRSLRERPHDSMRHSYSPPRPSNNVTASPTPNRSTRTACRAASAANSTVIPTDKAAGLKNRGEDIAGIIKAGFATAHVKLTLLTNATIFSPCRPQPASLFGASNGDREFPG